MRIYLIILKLALVVQIGLAQFQYSGIVQTVDGEPLILANIFSFEELKGWQTNFDGEYEFSAAKNLEVFITYIGFERLKVKLKLRDTITVKESNVDGGLFMPYPKYTKHYSGMMYPEFISREEFKKGKIDDHKINSMGSLMKGEQYYSYENIITGIEKSQSRVDYQVNFNIIELKPDSLNVNQFLILNEVESDKVLKFKDVIPIDALKDGIYEVYCLEQGECRVNSANVVQIKTQKSMLGVIVKL